MMSRAAPVTPLTHKGNGQHSSPITSQAEREQALRDYKVTIEYKGLKQHAPAGVYLIPSLDNLRHFYGVIFVRRGPFANGVFKFQIRLSEKYNDVDAWPQITFSSNVYHPYVDAETGELDVRSAYPTWDPQKHYLVTVLTHLKKIFYVKNFGDDEAPANPEARDLTKTHPAQYFKKVQNCVNESQMAVYQNEEGCTTKFMVDDAPHSVLRDLMKKHVKDHAGLKMNSILDMVTEAGNQTQVNYA